MDSDAVVRTYICVTSELWNWTDRHRVEFDEVLTLARRPSPSAGGTLLIDARPASSYEGGHIPTSLLLDFPSSLLKGPGNFTHLRKPEELKKHIAEQLGKDTLDEIVSRKVTVVNSEFSQCEEFYNYVRELIMVASLWRRPVGSDKLVISQITWSRFSTL